MFASCMAFFACSVLVIGVLDWQSGGRKTAVAAWILAGAMLTASMVLS